MKTQRCFSNRFYSYIQNNKRIKIETDSYYVIFSKHYIIVNKNLYKHSDWQNFTLKDLRRMPTIEMELWSRWGSFFNNLYKMYNSEV